MQAHLHLTVRRKDTITFTRWSLFENAHTCLVQQSRACITSLLLYHVNLHSLRPTASFQRWKEWTFLRIIHHYMGLPFFFACSKSLRIKQRLLHIFLSTPPPHTTTLCQIFLHLYHPSRFSFFWAKSHCCWGFSSERTKWGFISIFSIIWQLCFSSRYEHMYFPPPPHTHTATTPSYICHNFYSAFMMNTNIYIFIRKHDKPKWWLNTTFISFLFFFFLLLFFSSCHFSTLPALASLRGRGRLRFSTL